MERCSPSGRNLQLGAADVHIWCANLNVSGARLSALENYLWPDERARAGRFHFRRDRDRFVCAHGLLRELLSCYSRQDPGSHRFGYSEFGKPRVIQSSADIPSFNYSRSADMALFAFTRDRAVGIDIEQIQEDEEFLDIAVQYYTHSERTILDGLDARARMAEFFRYWTRREAFLKATGEGLGRLTNELEVESSVIRSSDGVTEWRIETLELVPGYASSIAVAGADWMLTAFELEDPAPPLAALRNAG